MITVKRGITSGRMKAEYFFQMVLVINKRDPTKKNVYIYMYIIYSYIKNHQDGATGAV